MQERPPRKKKGKAKVVSFAEPVSRPSGRAMPEAIEKIVNFYTTARVTQSVGRHPSATLKKVLVDGCSVLNMIPLSLARKMMFTLRLQTEIVMM